MHIHISARSTLIAIAALVLGAYVISVHIAFADSHDSSDRMTRDTRGSWEDGICNRLSQLTIDRPLISLALSAFCGVSVDISASPQSITLGQSSLLTWHSTNADSCVASGGWSGEMSTSGSAIVSPTGLSTNYILDCEGPGGSAQAAVNVSIAPAQLN